MLVCPATMLPTSPTPNLSDRKCGRRRRQVPRKNQFSPQNRANSVHPGSLGLTLDSDRNLLRDYSRNSWEAGSKSLSFCSQCSYSMKHPGHLGMVLCFKKNAGIHPIPSAAGLPSLLCPTPSLGSILSLFLRAEADTP